MNENNDLILQLIDINKDFSGVVVLENVNFDLKKGEIHAIAGQNGAGKSVLMKIVNGVYTRSSGKMLVDGQEVHFANPQDSRKKGIGMIYQEFSLIPTMNVARNIFLNREPKKGGLIDDALMNQSAKKILNDLGVDINPRLLVKDLSVSHKQLVEISKVVSEERKIIIMDEPTASLSHGEVELLNKVIRKLKADGISIIYITHHLNEIIQICDRVTVLRDGKKIITENVNDIDLSMIIEAMLGKKLQRNIMETKYAIDRKASPKLEVRDLDLGGKEKVSFKMWQGEVLGLAGLLGAGQDRIIKSIFGIMPGLNKELFVDGKKLNIKKPEDSLKHKITMVPEERQAQGLIIENTVRFNICLSILDKLKKGVFIDDGKANSLSKKYVKDLNIVTNSIFKKVKLLSGGNQQKVVIAKNLAADPDIMILNDPNFGVDVGSKQEILQLVRQFADEGNCAIFISSEFEEIAQVCDRVLILKDGSIINEYMRGSGPEITEESLLVAVQ
jgi:ribose transport system ATP-binding protein